MILKSTGGSSLEMTLVGYQFPDLETKEYDSNWLLIKIDAVHSKGQWTSVDPSLLTYEVQRLADWLAAIARGQKVDDTEEFMEPNLSFRLANLDTGARTLRVYFELESRPPWAKSDTANENDFWLEFPLGDLDLEAAARQLRDELRRYPQRAAR